MDLMPKAMPLRESLPTLPSADAGVSDAPATEPGVTQHEFAVGLLRGHGTAVSKAPQRTVAVPDRVLILSMLTELCAAVGAIMNYLAVVDDGSAFLHPTPQQIDQLRKAKAAMAAAMNAKGNGHQETVAP